jgi:hypothetical protein
MLKLWKISKLAAALKVKYFNYVDDAANFMGVNLNDLTEDELKKIYKQKALQLHPDVSQEENAEIKFKSLQNAYELLNNWLQEDDYPWSEEDDADEASYWAEMDKDEKYFEEHNLKEKLDDFSLTELMYYFAETSQFLFPYIEYKHNRIDTASDEELVDVLLLDWKELFKISYSYSRLSGVVDLVERTIMYRMYDKKFNQEQLRRLPEKQAMRLLEKYSVYCQNRAEWEHEI